MSLVLLQDRLVEQEHAWISPEDRGYYFGDGVYEVFRIYGGRLFEKSAHIKRLARSLNEVRIPLPYPMERIGNLLDELLAADPVQVGTLYIQITRGAAPRAHGFPPAGTAPSLMAYVKESARPVGQFEQGIKAATVPDIRWLRCDIKTLNLLPNVLARQEAAERGADEAVLHRNGTVTEGSSSNVMIVKDEKIRTHPANHFILNGVTRTVVLELADRLGIEVVQEPFGLEALKTADEVFLTSTSLEVTPVVEIDGEPAAGGKPGPITRSLQEAFAKQIGF